MSTSVSGNQILPVAPVTAAGTWNFSGSTVPANHTPLEMLSGSDDRQWVKACVDSATVKFVGLYNAKYADIQNRDNPHGGQVAPVTNGTDYVLVSGTVAWGDGLTTTSDGKMRTVSGTETVYMRALQDGSDEIIVAKFGEAAVA